MTVKYRPEAHLDIDWHRAAYCNTKAVLRLLDSLKISENRYVFGMRIYNYASRMGRLMRLRKEIDE